MAMDRPANYGIFRSAWLLQACNNARCTSYMYSACSMPVHGTVQMMPHTGKAICQDNSGQSFIDGNWVVDSICSSNCHEKHVTCNRMSMWSCFHFVVCKIVVCNPLLLPLCTNMLWGLAISAALRCTAQSYDSHAGWQQLELDGNFFGRCRDLQVKLCQGYAARFAYGSTLSAADTLFACRACLDIHARSCNIHASLTTHLGPAKEQAGHAMAEQAS